MYITPLVNQLIYYMKLNVNLVSTKLNVNWQHSNVSYSDVLLFWCCGADCLSSVQLALLYIPQCQHPRRRQGVTLVSGHGIFTCLYWVSLNELNVYMQGKVFTYCYTTPLVNINNNLTGRGLRQPGRQRPHIYSIYTSIIGKKKCIYIYIYTPFLSI